MTNLQSLSTSLVSAVIGDGPTAGDTADKAEALQNNQFYPHGYPNSSE